MVKVAIVMGSDSDLNVAKGASDALRGLKIPYETRVLSAHRTPEEAAAFAKGARENGFGAIIALAGRAAHLAGVLAANTALPVIGVPVSGGPLNGLDALLSTVQMPSGVPVATMAIDGAKNAALFAARILAAADDGLYARLEAMRLKQREDGNKKDAAMRASESYEGE